MLSGNQDLTCLVQKSLHNYESKKYGYMNTFVVNL